MSYSSLTYPGHVSFAGYAAPSPPSPCSRPYRRGVLWGDLTPLGPSGDLILIGTPYPLSEGDHGASRVPRHLCSCVPRSLTPTGPPGSHRYDPFVLASGSVTPSPPALAVTRLNCFGECGLPCGPQDSLCTLRMHCSAIQCLAQSSLTLQERVASTYLTSSVALATLDTGGWLGLTRQGLPPC